MTTRPFQLFGFMDAVREWMSHDEPSGDLLVQVAGFGAALETNPEALAEPDPEQYPLRFATIPGTEHNGWIVSITYTVEGRPNGRFSGEVRCQTVTCVRHPQPELLPTYPAPRHH